ncbi:MAG: outer rane receptor protein, partial [Acidobacteria bacterium]|nr:outer rane receptor protein [Acidobacteriota bacterium]
GVGHGYGQKFTVAGMRWESNKFYQDGMEIKGASRSAETPGSASGLMLGVDAIREFRLLTNNYSAEYGKKAGAAVVTVTKSGTNEIHGSAFAFHRNDNLDAAKWEDTARGRGRKPEFKRNNFGASLGGPIKRDKLFFFTNYEGVRERRGVTLAGIVPDENARRGCLPRGTPAQQGNCPAGFRSVAVARSIAPYLAIWPLPTGQNFGDGTAAFASTGSTATGEDFGMGRFDYNISESDSLFLSSTTSSAFRTDPNQLPVFALQADTRSYTSSLEWTHIFSPRLLHVANLGFNRPEALADPSPIVDIDPSLSFIPGAGFGLFQFNTSLSSFGNSDGANKAVFNTFQFTERFLYTAGSHSLKAGWQIQRIQRNTVEQHDLRGVMIFRDLDDLLAGVADEFNGLLTSEVSGKMLSIGLAAHPDFAKGWRQTYGAFYVEDSWKTTPTFTVDAGLRFEFASRLREVDGKTTRWLVDRIVPGGIIMKTTPQVGLPLADDVSLGWAPRLGLAWDPKGDGKTVIRAGGGMFFEQFDNAFRFFVAATPPFGSRAQFTEDFPFPNPYAGVTDVSSLTIEGRGVDGDITKATVFHYNLGVQWELFADMAFKLAYTGSRGYHLSNQRSSNLRLADILSDGRKFWPAGRSSANPILGEINMLTSNANSWYNGLRVEFEKRAGRAAGAMSDIRFKWAYTYARSIDTHSTDQSSQAQNSQSRPMDWFDMAREKSLSNFDVRHNMTFNFSYGLPRLFSRGPGAVALNDWALNGILVTSTGFPAAVDYGADRNLDNINADRPDLAPGANSNPVLGGPDRYFDSASFVSQPAGFLGNLGRNTLILPGLVSFDFSLFKSFSLSEKYRLEFRSEFFNLLNRPNFGVPAKRVFNSRGVPQGSAGFISNTVTSARQVQFGLRFEF